VAELKDSGARREFDSGAVRDITEGKGRCDLLPLDALALYYADENGPNMVFMHLHYYIYEGRVESLLEALNEFNARHWNDPKTMFLETSKHYEDGARKYSERNWEKGIPSHCYLDSGPRHYLKFLAGDTDEPHDRAFVWNVLCAIRTHLSIPAYVDLPFVETTKNIKKENMNNE
jgi:hypothetical protein